MRSFRRHTRHLRMCLSSHFVPELLAFCSKFSASQIRKAEVWQRQTTLTTTYLRDIAHKSCDTFSLGTVVPPQLLCNHLSSFWTEKYLNRVCLILHFGSVDVVGVCECVIPLLSVPFGKLAASSKYMLNISKVSTNGQAGSS